MRPRSYAVTNTSDAVPLEGTGPKAVEVILQEIGPVPVIFNKGTPEAAIRAHLRRASSASLHYPTITSAVQEMALLS